MTEVMATFRRDISALPDVFALVGRFFSRAGLDARLRFPVDFALEEVFTNFVRHNPEGRSDIDVRLSVEADQLKMVLTDFDSEPFDPNRDAPPVDIHQPIQERQPGGLGVHLVKTMVDRVEYDHADRTSRVTLYKSLR